jgi:4-amino-4-deoxy-L-arabinose transferase-like glycosyltransferase
MSRRIHLLILLALALGIYAGNAAKPALFDDVDSGHAIAAREMLERGDWAVMHINGIRWLEKAPLHYWLVASSFAVLGVGEFSTRLPLALAVVGLVWMVYVFGRHFFGEQAGFYAGLVMCTSVGTFLFTRTTIPEAIYSLLFTAAFYVFLRAWTGTMSPRAGYWGFATLVGLAVLTRSLIGVIFPVASVVIFLLLNGGWRRWRELPVVSGILVFLIVAAPWHLIVGLRTPGFFQYYFINEQFLRAIGARHPADYTNVFLPFWWAAHLLWLFPWSVFVGYALRELPPPRSWRRGLDAGGQARLLLFVWAGFILFFFSVSKRVEYYSFGAYPAMALLLGLGLARAEEERHRWLPRLQAALAVLGVVVGALLGTMLMSRSQPHGEADYFRLLLLKDAYFSREWLSNFLGLLQTFAGLRLPAAIAAASFVAGLGSAWWLRRRGRVVAANLATALCMAGFFASATLALQVFEPLMSSRPLAREIQRYLRPEDEIVLYSEFYNGSTIGFYTGRKTLIYNGRYQGLEFGSYYPDAPRIFLTDNDFPGVWEGPKRAFLFVPQAYRREVLLRLPAKSSYLLAESGGKAVYVNQAVSPGQATLAELAAREHSPKP